MAEGLTPALEQRERTHRMDADGSENYSRLAKSIVQVGTLDAGSQAQVTKPLGLPLEMQLTDRAGRASFTMPRDGTWLLNVIWTRPLPRSRETDFETIFSSLSFGFTSSQ
jgi:hypothetical protein